MTELVYHKETVMPCPAEELFRWHERPDAFIKLMPPGEPVRVIQHDGHIRDGARAVIKAGFRPLQFRWELEHQEYQKDVQFCDVQIKGPFKSWRHVHRMVPLSGGRESILSDHITFTMPMGRLGHWLGRKLVLPRLERLFEYRHTVTRKALTP